MAGHIEDVEIDVDLGGNDKPEMYMILSGDFETICKQYLEQNTDRLIFQISRNEADHLYIQLGKYLHD